MSADTLSLGMFNDADTLVRTYHIPFCKFDATAAPGVSDDDAAGYVAGSIWADRTNHRIYVCQNNATGAAVWAEVPSTGGYVTSISITSANGITGSSSGGASPSLTIALGAITPSSVAATGAGSFTITDNTTAPTILTLTHNRPDLGTTRTLLDWKLSTTTTANQLAAELVIDWATATDASRKARATFYVLDATDGRVAWSAESSGTAPMIGFLGAANVARQTGDAGTALVTFGLMSGTPTFAAANITGTLAKDHGGTGVDNTTQTYTPTLTNALNISASTAYTCQYFRIGNVVTVSGKFDIDPTAAGLCSLGISLPIASNFTAAEQCGGTAASGAVAGQSGAISGDTTNDRATLNFIAVDLANRGWSFNFTYLVA